MRLRYSKDLAGVDLAITGMPFDTATTNRPGARFGPAGVRAASALLAFNVVWPWGFDPFLRLAAIDYGDCAFDHGKPSETPARIEAHIAGILAAGASSLSIGGDHFLTLPILRAYAKKYGPMAIVHFDAHSDTWNDPEERIDHGTMFYHAVKEGVIDPGALGADRHPHLQRRSARHHLAGRQLGARERPGRDDRRGVAHRR